MYNYVPMFVQCACRCFFPGTEHWEQIESVMLVLVLGLGLRLEVWPWPKIQGQNVGGLQCSPWTSISTRVNYISRSTHLTYLPCQHWWLLIYASCQWWVMLLNCDCILVRVLEKTGFHYFIFHRKPLHWNGHGHGLGLGLECSGLVNITG